MIESVSKINLICSKKNKKKKKIIFTSICVTYLLEMLYLSNKYGYIMFSQIVLLTSL